MSLNVLLIGRLNIVVEDAKDQLDMPDVEFFTATELSEAKAIFRDHSIQHVFIGAGIEIEQKLEIVRAVFQDSDNTTVHLKDIASGPKGFSPFVQAVLSGLHPAVVREMTRVLVIGYDPDSVDFTDPALPRGVDAEKMRAGVALGMRQMRDRGWQAEHCDIWPDANAVPTVERQLASASYDCIVIGAGVRLSSRHPEVFEAAPGAKISFNAAQDDIPEAAARLLSS